MKMIIMSVLLLLVTGILAAQRVKLQHKIPVKPSAKPVKPLPKKVSLRTMPRGRTVEKISKHPAVNPVKQVKLLLRRPPIAAGYHSRKVAAPDSIVLAVKGTLARPCTGCSVLEPYGNNWHGSYALYNPGITFVSPAPVAVLSSHAAIVENVVQIEGMYVVLASWKHLYFAYSNLKEVLVKKGDSLTAGMALGTLSMDEKGNYTLLFLLSVHGKTVNPVSWFSRPAANLAD